MFTKSLPVDVATHIWDAFFIEGDVRPPIYAPPLAAATLISSVPPRQILFFETVLGILALREDTLQDLNFEGIIKSLTKLNVRLRTALFVSSSSLL